MEGTLLRILFLFGAETLWFGFFGVNWMEGTLLRKHRKRELINTTLGFGVNCLGERERD